MLGEREARPPWSCWCETCEYARLVIDGESFFDWSRRVGWVLSYYDYASVAWGRWGVPEPFARESFANATPYKYEEKYPKHGLDLTCLNCGETCVRYRGYYDGSYGRRWPTICTLGIWGLHRATEEDILREEPEPEPEPEPPSKESLLADALRADGCCFGVQSFTHLPDGECRCPEMQARLMLRNVPGVAENILHERLAASSALR